MTDGYATISIEDIGRIDGEPAAPEARITGHAQFTDALGCSDTAVDGFRLPAGATIECPARDEQLCVPIDPPESLRFESGEEIPPAGLGRVPAGNEAAIRAPGATDLFVISAPAEPGPAEPPTVVDLDDCEFPAPETSTIGTARLTGRLGCAGMKVNARVLDPGEHVPYHTEGNQEELFVPVCGPASMRIDGEPIETPVGTVTRVAPPVPRSARNDGDRRALWVMVGAPPTGGPEEWDPGAEILE